MAACLPSIKMGVPMLTSLISSIVTGAVGFGLGWYVKGRGMTGVQIDLNNVKTDVENLKNKLFPVQATPVVAPITN